MKALKQWLSLSVQRCQRLAVSHMFLIFQLKHWSDFILLNLIQWKSQLMEGERIQDVNNAFTSGSTGTCTAQMYVGKL